MEDKPYYSAYENRYQKVYEAEVEWWGHTPDDEEKGMIVKIAKVIKNATFYDLRLEDVKYHRWLADFEITYPI